jgi:LCP family protein required for cell wall assembly
MTGSDDGTLGGELGPGETPDAPFRRIVSAPDAPADDAIPGPRPGYYPPVPPSEAEPPSERKTWRWPTSSESKTSPWPKAEAEPAAGSSGPGDGQRPPGPRPAAPHPPGGTGRVGARRRPGPSPAQRQLMARISASRRARQRRALLTASALLSVLVLLIAGSAWGLTSYINGHLGRVNAGTSGTPASGPLNIVVAGLDERSGLTPHQQALLHVGSNQGELDTDTLMLVHVPASHRYVQVVSLPRDSWVNIPGHGMNKINSALNLGGPQLMVQTIEQATGLTVNDYIEVNFLGFVKVIDALGGVNICLPYAVDDPYSGLHMAAGEHHVDGITALEFARDRHSFPTSDLARIQDQQQLISTALSEGISSGMLANPLRLERFLSAASATVRVDQGFNVVRVADQLRGISAHDVTFTTVPLSNLSYMTPSGESAVLWNASAASALFNDLKNDQPPAGLAPAGHARAKSAGHGLKAGQVSVDVYNGTLIGGLSADTGTQLAALGFQVHRSGLDWTSQNLTQTVIQYPAGQEADAKLVARAMPGAGLQEVKGLPRVRILLGSSNYSVQSATPGAQSSPGQNSSPVQQRTAAQDACH